MRIFIHLLIVLLSLALATQEAASKDSSEAAKSAPAFELKDTAGTNVSLSEFKGKIVLLNFWATWCSACRAEMPGLNRLYTEFNSRGFVVLAVTIDHSEKLVRKFIAEKAINFPVLMDPEKEVSFDQYAVLTLPVSFLIDRNGVILEKLIGERDWESAEIKDKIARALKKR
jgi:peroxiredoxin